MAVTGISSDIALQMFTSGFMLEAQQSGSVLTQTCTQRAMQGSETRIKKIGKMEATLKTSMFEDIELADAAFEYRLVYPQPITIHSGFDKDELVRLAENPSDPVIKNLANGMGRKRDLLIAQALQGSATYYANGASSTQALTLQVAAGSTVYGSGTGATSLTPQKLKEGIAKLMAGYGYNGNERLFCVGKVEHLMNLLINAEIISKDYRPDAKLDGPGIVKALDGFMGINFIAYEGFTNVSSSEPVYLFTQDALTLGTWIPLSVRKHVDPGKKFAPEIVSIEESVGAVRMDEAKVVEILCTSLI